MANRFDDMELMKKILLFTRKNRPGIGPFRPPVPPMPPFGGHRLPEEMPPFGPRGPHGPHDFQAPHGPQDSHGPHGPHDPHCPHEPGFRRPPLSREHLLVIIGENPEGIRQKAIMEKAGIGQSSVSELINKLEDDGYIERKVDPSDKRATLLFLTEKGQARALEVEDENKEFFADVFAKLNDDEKKALSDIMDKLLSE